MRNYIFRIAKKYKLKAFAIAMSILILAYSMPSSFKNSEDIISRSMEYINLDVRLKNVKISGIENTKASDIVNIVSDQRGISLTSIDLKKISSEIDNIDWVKKSELRKIYPSTLEVQVYEHNPIAIWYNEGDKFLVDRDSKIITELNPNKFKNLKVVAGPNALEDIPVIISMIKKYPEFEKKIKSLLRVGDRRWTIRLHNGITIHLPEKNIANAIEEIEDLDNEYSLLSRYIEIIDMRLPDRIDILPTGVIMNSSKI
ncbi:MAG: hypothetical protein CML88_01895 [Rhodobiaceae bacterium]|nr:hypothetical protein [Rhodobiaceae bacterium]|tara:strand:- start:568 stop:1338 length:771 start_codon:yes stop_codon:yes gene_type:complete